ncbi:MAG: nucleotidyl transferase AbiEii/AbiGii toxin family protein [bacterium]|nr:nucleotidyl transferase AbiEii/AbiGii toxin family protein [bacterium]
MITVAEIRERATKWSLPEETVEKDYVLGWMLWGISRDPRLADHWVFKGGTCLKKCFIETYRFSEDLDFTVTESKSFLPEDLLPVLRDVLSAINHESGIDLQSEIPRLKVRPRGHSVEGRVYYIGPRRTPTATSIKLDLTMHECVVLPHVHRDIRHVYTDNLPQPCQVRCYAFEEVFAEKIRAMGERCRPRDLYDIINLYRHEELRGFRPLIYNTLKEKCKFKGISTPSFTMLEKSPFRAELEIEWANMLAHQLPALPPLDAFWNDLPSLFMWLKEEHMSVSLPKFPISEEESLWLPTSQEPNWDQGIPIDTICFAGLNRLCLEFRYHRETQIIEPYSLRRTTRGNLILHGRHSVDGEHRTYRADHIENMRVTNQIFSPVYQVELPSITHDLVHRQSSRSA